MVNLISLSRNEGWKRREKNVTEPDEKSNLKREGERKKGEKERSREEIRKLK